jgi:hypothetical protein
VRILGIILCTTLAACWAVGDVQSTPIPTGVASWYDSTTGKTSRAFSGGGEPVLNYQKANSTWDWIVDDWVPIGERQLWKSVRGNHRAWADSLGATIYAKGEHYLGMDPPKLGRFKKTDSSWTLLSEFEPDSITVAEGTITYWGAYYGVNISAVNNAKVFQTCTPYEFTFTQAFRDSAANMPAGFWQDALIATAIPLVTDSLNLTFHTKDGIVNWDIKGKLLDGWVRAQKGDTVVWTLPRRTIEDTDIPVWTRLVIRGGYPYLVELFDPAATVGLPPGPIIHSATFGDTDTTGTQNIDTQKQPLCWLSSPASSGTVDSLASYGAAYNALFDGNLLVKGTIYVLDGSRDMDSTNCIDTEEITFFAGGIGNLTRKWRFWEFTGSKPTVTGGAEYGIAFWSSNVITVGYAVRRATTAEAGDTLYIEQKQYVSSDAWPPMDTHIAWEVAFLAYYTEAAADTPSRRRHVLLKGR